MARQPARPLVAALAALLLAVGVAQAADARYFVGVARGTEALVEAQATITTASCTFTSPNSWCAVWVAIEAGGNPPWNIVQIGTIIFPPLWGMTPRVFWAAGSADSFMAPTAIDLGPAPPGAHHFRVRVVTTDWTGRTYDRVQVYMDGRFMASVPIAKVPWIRRAASASWQCEMVIRSDRCFARMTNMRIRRSGGPSVVAFPRAWVGYREPFLRIRSTTEMVIGP